jgi:hypothetical protein
MQSRFRYGYTCVFFLIAAGCYGNNNTPPPSNNDPACQINSPAEHTPGWPYDLPTFRDQVLPMMVQTCGMAGCHASPGGNGGLAVWVDAAPGNCSYAKTFNSVIAKTDLTNPTNSPVYVAITGGDPLHPFKVATTDAKAAMLLSWVQNASQTNNSSSSGGTPPPSANPFDYNVFQMQIQPILDTAEGKGCTGAACHGGPQGQGTFKLVANPAANSADMQANFNAVVQRCDLTTPEQSKFFLQATNRHASGASAVVSGQQGQSILGWIQTAKTNAPPPGGGNGGGTSCPSPSNFDQDVFRAYILPILLGQVDLNNPGSPPTTTGCARTTCHGADRTGGALVIKETNDVATNLASFACFVNLQQPSASEILVCPLNQPGCRRSPHPGQMVFSGAGDLNFQRVLSYLYAAKTSSTPIDFAFYVRQIDPIFNDINAVQAGAQNRTCADNISCHGTAIAGGAPANGSNFGLIPNATGKERLAVNFAQATNFIDFVRPTASALFLYPTDDVSNLANPAATGLHHPGGPDFADNSVQATAILQWARGIRPDGQGFVSNFLVAGDYSATQISDPTQVDETNVKPAIFDADGASTFNNGQWDGLFAGVGSQTVDLNLAFPRAQTGGRVAYAVAYIINTSPYDIQAQLTITSPNAVKLWVGAQPIVQSDQAQGGVTGLATLSAWGAGKTSTRVLVKVLQRAGDNGFNFTMRLTDQLGNPLTDATGELVLKLGPDGGI